MLTQSDFINIEKQALKIYENLELQIIEEIATRIANLGYANTVVINDIKIAQEMGFLYQDIIKLVAEYNNTSYEKIAEIFSDAGAKTLKFDDKIHIEAGKNPLPINQSPNMVQLLNATIEKTAGNLQNLVMTTAVTSQTQFYNAMNSAYLEVSRGVKSYSQSILDAIDKMSSTGGTVIYPSGRQMSIESAVRMNIITGVNQTCGKLQELRADEVGCDLMELTAHSGARPSHASWQGKIVSRSGKKGYLSLQDIGYGTATGFKGVNCRHDWYPYYKGSSRTYTQEQLNTWKNEKVTYNGKKYSKYEASQIQRKIERQIRQDKKELAGLQGVLTSNSKDSKLIENTKLQLINKQSKLKEHNSILNDFIKQTNSRKDYTRLYVGKAKARDIPEFKHSVLKQQEKTYSKKELKKLAEETNKLANTYTSNKSKWSGKIIESKRRVSAKLWNCNIEIENNTSPHALLHEQLHAHSISYYNRETYKKYWKIEEAVVEFYTKEIGKRENIININSEYDKWVTNLKEINNKIRIDKNDFEFAQRLFNIPVNQRLAFLEDEIQKYLSNKTINEAIELNKLMEVFYD